MAEPAAELVPGSVAGRQRRPGGVCEYHRRQRRSEHRRLLVARQAGGIGCPPVGRGYRHEPSFSVAEGASAPGTVYLVRHLWQLAVAYHLAMKHVACVAVAVLKTLGGGRSLDYDYLARGRGVPDERGQYGDAGEHGRDRNQGELLHVTCPFRSQPPRAAIPAEPSSAVRKHARGARGSTLSRRIPAGDPLRISRAKASP